MQRCLTVLLCIVVTVVGLKVHVSEQHAGAPKESSADAPHLMKAKPIAINRQGNMSAIEAPPKKAKSKMLVWFLGCSVDQNALMDACIHVGAAVVGDEYRHFYCTFDGLTLVYTFHPGATAPPYYNDGLGNDYNEGYGSVTTHSIVKSKLLEMKHKFGKLPDATIVDSDIWDVASWWQRRGEPDDWHAPHKLISEWRQVTIPSFLDFVQDANPHGRVALRSPPPVFDTRWRDWTRNLHETIEEMSTMLTKSTNEAGLLTPTKYPLIDYHQVTLSEGKALGGPLHKWYMDDLHPGKEIGLALMGAALKWANACHLYPGKLSTCP